MVWESRLHFCRRMAALLCGMMAPLAIAQSPRLTTPSAPVQIRSYSIDLSLDPTHHSLSAKTRVDFTASQNLATVEFQLNPALRIASVTDASETV